MIPAAKVNPSVLNVNDREASRYLVSQMLRGAGFTVSEAPTGLAAIDSALKSPPDAVVLDVRLPDLDGYEVCRRLKAEPATRSVPVILTSALYVDTEHKVDGFAAGADGYLTQPFESAELSATLRALLRVREAERDARRLADELREAIRVRDEFLSIAAHELKTPLTSLQLQLDGIQRLGKKELDGTWTRRLEPKMATAIRQTSRLTVLIDDLLDVSRITQGRFVIEPAEVDLEQLVREVLERFEPEAERFGSTLGFEPCGPLTQCVDPQRIDQLVSNLVSNAIKYGGAHPVTVRLAASATGARLSVSDHGFGVAEADRARIFGRFERAVSSRHYGGLGLGLFICQQIVDAHQGTIHVEPTPGHGATFVVELPAKVVLRANPEVTP